MAIKTSNGSGNLSDGTKWVGGVAPTTGDQISILTGHAIAIDGAITLGNSVPSTPITLPTISLTTGTTVTSLPTGTYQLRYTFVDAGGGESHPGPNISSGAMTISSSKPRVTFPALPTGVSSISLYLTNTGGAAGTERRYATGITTTTYDLVSASYENGTVAFASAAAWVDKVAIRVVATGTLTNSATGNLTMRGDMVLGNTTMTLNGGSIWEFDSSAANSPANTNYCCWLGSTSSQTSCKIQTSGTSINNRAIVRSNAGGGNGRFQANYFAFGAFSDVGQWDVQYIDFLRLGTATVGMLSWSSTAQAGYTFRWQDFTVTSCGRFGSGSSAIRATDIYAVSRGVFTSSLDSTTPFGIGSQVAKTGGSRTCDGNSFDARVAFPSMLDVVFSDNYFPHGFSITSSGVWDATSRGNFIRQIGTEINNDATIPSALTDCYFFSDPTGTTDLNPHFFGFQVASGNTITHTGIIFEYAGADPTGDCFLHGSGTGTVVIKNCIGLPNTALDCPGTLLTIGADVSTLTINIEHCTWHVGNQSLVQYNEGTPKNHAGMIGSLKSNLCYDETGSTKTGGGLGRYIMCDSFNSSNPQTITPADVVSAANADYNGLYQLRTTGYKGAYNANITGSPGAHDVSLDASGGPNFVDGLRNLKKWDLSLGGAGTNAAALARIAADPSLTRSSLIPYIKAGFVVQNSLLNNAGHDGVTIGAQGYQAASTPVPVITGGFRRRVS